MNFIITKVKKIGYYANHTKKFASYSRIYGNFGSCLAILQKK